MTHIDGFPFFSSGCVSFRALLFLISVGPCPGCALGFLSGQCRILFGMWSGQTSLTWLLVYDLQTVIVIVFTGLKGFATYVVYMDLVIMGLTLPNFTASSFFLYGLVYNTII